MGTLQPRDAVFYLSELFSVLPSADKKLSANPCSVAEPLSTSRAQEHAVDGRASGTVAVCV